MARIPAVPPRAGEGIWRSIRQLSRNRWALAVLAFTMLEGILLVGIFASLPVALQTTGVGVLVAGLVTAAFGVSVLVVSQTMKIVLGRWPSWLLLLLAGSAGFLGYLAIAFTITPVSVLIAAGFLGVAWALGHTTIQTWMTDAVSNGRAMGMSFFSIALFAGSTVGAALGQGAAGAHTFPLLFLVAAAAAAMFAIVTSLARSRYRVRER